MPMPGITLVLSGVKSFMKKILIIILISAGLVVFDTSGAKINANPSVGNGSTAITTGMGYGVNIKTFAFGTAGIFTPGSPYPRVITPNEDGVNDYVFFFFDTTDAPVDGRIYDLNSVFVANMKPGPNKPDLMSLIWDGKDSSGRVVPMGVYLYKVTIGKESVTGTLVVAR